MRCSGLAPGKDSQTWIQIQVNAGSTAEETLQATEWDRRMRKCCWTIMIISLIKNLDFCLRWRRWKFPLKQSYFPFLCLASTGSCPGLFTICAIRGFIWTYIMYCVFVIIHKKTRRGRSSEVHRLKASIIIQISTILIHKAIAIQSRNRCNLWWAVCFLSL